MVKYKDMQFFYGEFENEQKKDKRFFDPPERGFDPQIFSNFPAHDLNFHGREGDEIKSKQASKRERTLHVRAIDTYVLLNIFCSHLASM